MNGTAYERSLFIEKLTGSQTPGGVRLGRLYSGFQYKSAVATASKPDSHFRRDSLVGAALAAARAWVDSRFGLYLPISAPEPREWWVLAAVAASGTAVGAVPALRAYRMSLADGMTVRV